MKTGSVVQVGGAVRHNPLPPLVPFLENSLVEVTADRSSSFKGVQSSLGGFLGGGQLAWRANGATIEVIDPLNCTRLAAWTFGAILHNTAAKVTCVCSSGVSTVTHVIVGLDLGDDHNPQGMVGVLSLRRSRIIRAFQFRHKVTNVCMVTEGDKLVDSNTLAPELRPCKGLLAVATGHVFLFLVDLALDLGANEITSDEATPATFVDISFPDAHADIKRKEAIAREYHPMLCLSENFSSGGHFQLLGPDDEILFEAPSYAVGITTLSYIPQLASLIVGYSFGAFQIINLSIITIDCTSPYEENLPPLFAFAYQEPENDPRSFVYLWVCRSWPLEIDKGKSDSLTEKASCSLYAMNYEKKEWIEGHGLWYQGLQNMSPRFEFDATGGVGQRLMSLKPSKIFSAMTVVVTTPSACTTSPLNPGAAYMIVPSDEESDPVPELSLCTFCWEGKCLDQGREAVEHYIAIFDINQWYQAQMPSHLRLQENTLCPYMSFHMMDKVPKSANETLLSASPKMGSWSRHSSKSHCENDWYPSSLSYEFHLLTSEGLVTYRCPSVQQSAISALTQLGPGAIVNPHTVFSDCLFAGILPSEVTANCSGSTVVSEREQLLNVALEHHLLSLIVQCVVEFSEGRFAHVGCSLQLLLDWAWNKIRTIKESYDNLCVPLFSTTEASVLSDAGLITLHQNLTYLSHLTSVVKAIKENAGEVTLISAGELEGRVQVVQLLELHLQAILWFYHSGLLPQCNQEEMLDGKSVPFPAKALRNIYDQRRSDISNLNVSDLLLIDCLLEESGSLLLEIWAEDGREDIKTIYPPPNIHSLLNMYLLPGMTTSTKHRIIQYMFLDLVSLLSDNYLSVVEEFVKFPASVSMSPSINKLTQAFWLIDQKDFEMGLSVLLDPLVNPGDITPLQHQRIIKAFLFQGEEAHALSYIQLRQPPETNLEDIRINLSVLLANGRIREAFHYQRKRRVASSAKELLHHLFAACEHLGRLESIVHLPLSPMEEEAFINYLHTSSHPASQDILLVYYLQQSRFEEISKLHDGFKDACNSTHDRQKTRNALVQGYLSHLPDVRAQALSCKETKSSKTMYTKPQPLSARIRLCASSSSTPTSKAKGHLQSLQSSKMSASQSIPYTPFRSKVQRRNAIKDWSEEVGLIIKNANHPEQKSQRNASQIVFPTLHEESNNVNEASNLLLTPVRHPSTSVSKYRYSALNNISSLKEDISKAMEDILRKSFRTSEPIENISKPSKISSGVIALLKTPPVHRKSLNQLPANDSFSETPQSILKVRKIIQRSQSPSEMEIPVPSFPLHRSVNKNFRESSEISVTGSESGSLTPKQLRFDLPSRKLSVDENNSIVIGSSEFVLPVFQGTGIKRKRSDESLPSSTDIPTPRKPLPKFVVSEMKLSDGFSSDSDSEEQEEREASPSKSIVYSCSRVIKDSHSDTVVRETTETRIESKSITKDSFQGRSDSNLNLNAIRSISRNLTEVNDPKICSKPVEEPSAPGIVEDHYDVINDLGTASHHSLTVESQSFKNVKNQSFETIDDEAVGGKELMCQPPRFTDSVKDGDNSAFSLQSFDASETSKDNFESNTPTIGMPEISKDISGDCSQNIASSSSKVSKNSTLRLNMREAKKLLNHFNQSLNNSAQEKDSSLIADARADGKEAVKNFLNEIFGSDNNAMRRESQTPKLRSAISLQKSFSNDFLLHESSNSNINTSVIVNNGKSSAIFNVAGDGHSPSLSNGNAKCVEFMDISTKVCVENEDLSAVLLNKNSSQHIISDSNELIGNDTNKISDKVGMNISYIPTPNEDLEIQKRVTEEYKQKTDISMESVEDVFEEAVETLSFTENPKSVSQFAINTSRIPPENSIDTSLGAANQSYQIAQEETLSTRKSNLQTSIHEFANENNVSFVDDMEDNYILKFSDSEEDNSKYEAPVEFNRNPELTNVVDSANNAIQSKSMQLSRVESYLGIHSRLENTLNIPMYLSDTGHQVDKSDLNDYLIPDTKQSIDGDFLEEKADDSYIPVIEFSDDEDEGIVDKIREDEIIEEIMPDALLTQVEVSESSCSQSSHKSENINHVISIDMASSSPKSRPIIESSEKQNEVTALKNDANSNSKELSVASFLSNVENSQAKVPEYELKRNNMMNRDQSLQIEAVHHDSSSLSGLNNLNEVGQSQMVNDSYIPIIEFSDEENDDTVDNVLVSKENVNSCSLSVKTETYHDNLNKCSALIESVTQSDCIISKNDECSESPRISSANIDKNNYDSSLAVCMKDGAKENKLDEINGSINITEYSDSSVKIVKENSNDGYHSDDSGKTIEFDFQVARTAIKEPFVPLQTVLEAANEKEETELLESCPDNNNISKIVSSRLEGIWASGRKKPVDGLDTSVIIEDGAPLSAPNTPLRRSRRLSSSTPTKLFETPKRRQRRYSEASDVGDEEVFMVSTSSSKSQITPSKTKKLSEEISESSDLIVEEIIPTSAAALRLETTPLKELVTNRPSTPLSNVRAQKVSRSGTPQRIDTPIRRSSRLNGSFDSLRTIVEENKDLPKTPLQKTPLKKTPLKKTPLRSKRKSIVNLDPLLETISEDSELKAKIVDEEILISRLSPMEATLSTSTRTRMKRGQSLEPDTPTNSIMRSRRGLSRGRRKSASVSPELLSKIINESEDEKGKNRRSSKYADVSCSDRLAEHLSQDLGDLQESKENEDINQTYSDQIKHSRTIISPAGDESPGLPLSMRVLSKNNSNKRSYVRRKSSMTFTLPKDIDLSFEFQKDRKTYARKSTLSSSILEIKRNKSNLVTANGETILEPYENGSTEEIGSVDEHEPLAVENSPAFTYNLLEAPVDSNNLSIIRASLSTNKKGQKRRRIMSLSVPVDRDPGEIDLDLVSTKRPRKSSTSKGKSTKSLSSKSDVSDVNQSSKSDVEENQIPIESDTSEVSPIVSQRKRGARNMNRKRQ